MRKHLFAGVDTRLFGLAVLERRKIFAVFYLLLIAVRPERRQNIRKDYYNKYKSGADHRNFVFSKASEAVSPEVDAFPHDLKTFLFVQSSRSKIIGIQVQTGYYLFHYNFPPVLT